ncbi:alpha/beta fold hydrolase [Pseudoalteromonas luteoviolacea]|uniref:AB hydrolase-1 domain-containing protein n=1 Tax=Pseudoalteromonas luteoviolacea S4054 TaxID=1129367 RepID=A0A0F6A694_9GAMM|nr:alpha/beta hydrolase [Pseudoalteromonas luteoviolacea]AOT10392.1 oxidoreductase [Pseudoalteromonas luteoviolacea]AOT15538.1 oxidoreductase [Pseudoalteromonas luteoviolacea]AOT20211.1 oxidoreductase [Pseudoalteromonas luteoviolacea]KKE80949.1 hypothetical protein N479_24120 [Pseudoalteromonas luteoviolacea S4054]KZN64686.1 hypothetical protein N481_25365 [Pseudoalteromonas luteoviolacea S4047-1]
MSTSGYIKIDDASIYYQMSGNLKGKPLVLLHGGLGSMEDLTPVHKYLDDEYCLICIDFRGHGKSTLGSTKLSYEQYQNDVLSILSFLGISQFSLFGFSDGGIVAYRIAAQSPEKVSCLITLGSQWRLEPEDPSIPVLKGLTAEFWLEKFADDVAYYQLSNPTPHFHKLVDAVKTVWLDTSESGYPNNAVVQIQCPTLIMRGDHDFLFSLDEAVALQRKVAGADFANVPFTEHAAHQESPELVGRILQQFMLKIRCDL